jgi:hypothetical protein
MNSLSGSQRWALVGIVASSIFVFAALVLEGTVQTLAFVFTAMAVGAYAIITSQDEKTES